ncbi:MAG: tRNA pseudouridine(55) synthase TruB [Bacteroidales bacterium]|nr:tRNA pseudouridine(55) synthase TruB [Bacteroidales bacterium]MCL2739188.1 tRNA pseudouridine(55) synthase TruB [Bacteroidales bacterium]
MLIIQKPIQPEWGELLPESCPLGIVLSLDKPYGWTSADAVRKIKFVLQRQWRIKNLKVGHAGTLDPLATGILLICIGKATKAAESLQAQEKEYIASIRLGATTPSFDLEKEIDQTFPYTHITEDAIANTLLGMTGPQQQIPPQFSAKIIDGVRAYEWARSGIQTALKPAQIEIYEAKLLQCRLPDVVVQIRCSKGTYIRAFARDLGLALGSGAHLTDLVRSKNGPFLLDRTITMEDFSKIFTQK